MTTRSPVRTRAVRAPGSPGALKPDPVRDEIARLGDLDLDALRLRWRKLLRASAPLHLPRHLLLRIIAYRIQANAYGDLDRATLRFLDKIAFEQEARRASGEKRRGVPPIPPRRSLKPGTEFVREHAGTMHRVVRHGKAVGDVGVDHGFILSVEQRALPPRTPLAKSC